MKAKIIKSKRNSSNKRHVEGEGGRESRSERVKLIFHDFLSCGASTTIIYLLLSKFRVWGVSLLMAFFDSICSFLRSVVRTLSFSRTLWALVSIHLLFVNCCAAALTVSVNNSNRCAAHAYWSPSLPPSLSLSQHFFGLNKWDLTESAVRSSNINGFRERALHATHRDFIYW